MQANVLPFTGSDDKMKFADLVTFSLTVSVCPSQERVAAAGAYLSFLSSEHGTLTF